MHPVPMIKAGILIPIRAASALSWSFREEFFELIDFIQHGGGSPAKIHRGLRRLDLGHELIEPLRFRGAAARHDLRAQLVPGLPHGLGGRLELDFVIRGRPNLQFPANGRARGESDAMDSGGRRSFAHRRLHARSAGTEHASPVSYVNRFALPGSIG